jgi:hypothetical protein
MNSADKTDTDAENDDNETPKSMNEIARERLRDARRDSPTKRALAMLDRCTTKEAPRAENA